MASWWVAVALATDGVPAHAQGRYGVELAQMCALLEDGATVVCPPQAGGAGRVVDAATGATRFQLQPDLSSDLRHYAVVGGALYVQRDDGYHAVDASGVVVEPSLGKGTVVAREGGAQALSLYGPDTLLAPETGKRVARSDSVWAWDAARNQVIVQDVQYLHLKAPTGEVQATAERERSSYFLSASVARDGRYVAFTAHGTDGTTIGVLGREGLTELWARHVPHNTAAGVDLCFVGEHLVALLPTRDGTDRAVHRLDPTTGQVSGGPLGPFRSQYDSMTCGVDVARLGHLTDVYAVDAATLGLRPLAWLPFDPTALKVSDATVELGGEGLPRWTAGRGSFAMAADGVAVPSAALHAIGGVTAKDEGPTVWPVGTGEVTSVRKGSDILLTYREGANKPWRFPAETSVVDDVGSHLLVRTWASDHYQLETLRKKDGRSEHQVGPAGSVGIVSHVVRNDDVLLCWQDGAVSSHDRVTLVERWREPAHLSACRFLRDGEQVVSYATSVVRW